MLGNIYKFFLLFPKILKILQPCSQRNYQPLRKKLYFLVFFSFVCLSAGYVFKLIVHPSPLIGLGIFYFLIAFFLHSLLQANQSSPPPFIGLASGVFLLIGEVFYLREVKSFSTFGFLTCLEIICLEILSGSSLIFLLNVVPLVEGQGIRRVLSFSLARLGSLLDIPMALFFLSLLWLSFESSLYTTSPFFLITPWFCILCSLLLLFRIYHQLLAEPRFTGILMRSLGPNHFQFSFRKLPLPSSIKITSFSLPSYVLECWTCWILLLLIAFRGTSLFSSALLPFQEHFVGKTGIFSFSFHPLSPAPFKLQLSSVENNSLSSIQSLVLILNDRSSPFHVIAPSLKKEKEGAYYFSAKNFSHPGNWQIKILTKTKDARAFHTEGSFEIHIPSGWNPNPFPLRPFVVFMLLVISFTILLLFISLYRFSVSFATETKILANDTNGAEIFVNYFGPNVRSKLATFCSALILLGIAFLF
ncbi:hypothetical protein A946_01140 [Methylacidiphilum kamchatkense Kam1]|uniref:YtkA-like protein n=1 Tax=Methylacidiphilum kamchatkense Kam1 TaxID=1202785 RepID=A0ABR4ZYM0_9BACT|nr:hypothetical protein A946_01140 [Methylacidiphilum kamchatkense Kam1]